MATLALYFPGVDMASVGSRFENCDESARFSPPASLLRRGVVYVFQPNLGLYGGGSRGLHALHSTLLRAGFDSRMHFVNPKLLEDPLYSVNMSQLEWEGLLKVGLGADDVLVVPELLVLDGDWVIDALERQGGLVVRWVLGKHDNGHFEHVPRLLHLASTRWISEAHLAPGDVLDPPLDDEIYAAARERVSWRSFKEDGANCPALPRNNQKGPLVLVDDDTIFDDGLMNTYLRIAAESSGMSQPFPFTTRLVGFSRADTITLFKRAKVLVDLYLPGKERSGFEGLLFGAIPIISDSENGQSWNDYPPNAVHRFSLDDSDDPSRSTAGRGGAVGVSSDGTPVLAPGVHSWLQALAAETSMSDTDYRHALLAAQIVGVLANYDALAKRVAVKLAPAVWGLPGLFRDTAVGLFGLRHLQVVSAASSPGDLEWVLPLLVSSLVTNPLANVLVKFNPLLAAGGEAGSKYWLRSKLGFAAWDILQARGLVRRLVVEPWPGLPSGGRWPRATHVAFAAPGSEQDRLYSLRVAPGTLVVGSAALSCSVRALESQNNASAVPLLGAPSQDGHTETVALLCASSSFSALAQEALADEDVASWGTLAAKIENPGLLGPASLARPLHGAGTVLRARGCKAQPVPAALARHPLWQALFPLFSVRVRRHFSPAAVQ